MAWLQWWQEQEEDEQKEALLARQSTLDAFFSLAQWQRPSSESSSCPTLWLHRMVYGNRTRRIRPKAPGLFFQKRVRSEGDMFRAFTSSPIYPAEIVQETTRKIVLQPVNFRNENGEKHPKLPDHNKGESHTLNETCKRILECYFGNGSVMLNAVR